MAWHALLTIGWDFGVFFATFEHGMGVFDSELPHLPGRVYESLSSLPFASYVGLELWDLRSRF